MNSSEGGFGLPPEMATPDMDEAKASIRSLAERDADRVHCYHGGPIDAGPDELRELAGG